jgi:hypothetical protein
MSLEETFPEDPWLPSLSYAATAFIPFNLPWGTEFIKIGTGFHSKRAKSRDCFATECAFDQRSLNRTRLRYRSEAGGSYSHIESSFGSHSQDSMDFSLGASADIAIVNVSGQAKFEQHAIANSDVSCEYSAVMISALMLSIGNQEYIIHKAICWLR